MRSLKTYAVLVSACALIILSKGRIDFASPLFADWDLHSYRLMAIASPHLVEDAIAPFCYRLLGPYLVGLLPLPDPLAFWLLNSLACLALALLFFQFLIDQKIRSDVAVLTVLLFTCNRYFFGFFAWDPFQIDDVLALICILLCFSFLFKGSWLAFTACLALGCLTREVVLVVIPVSFFYLWERGKLRQDYQKMILATAPAFAVFILVRIFVYADHASIGIHGILPFYWMKLGESVGNAVTPQAWFRRLIWCYMPLTLVPMIFLRTTISFFSARKYLLLFLFLVVLTDLWGIGAGGGDAERYMAPSFLAFYWIIGEIMQHEFSPAKWVFPALFACGLLASLHHLQGIYPLPSKRATLLVTLIGFFGVTLTAFFNRYGGWRVVGDAVTDSKSGGKHLTA
jgi:hypothetical protein